jgi:hypothetical protein
LEAHPQSTGSGVRNHDILSLVFKNSFQPIDNPVGNPVPAVPEVGTMAGSILPGALTLSGEHAKGPPYL